ncbi:MAG: sulfatase-like hydrolase/transferase [Actinobacteria bacterium]|nr:sulfatase-like hydrolase/transferase [Actinomycetota bacterium]
MGEVNGWRRLAVLCALSAAAVAGPLLDLYGRNPEVFVANRTSPWEMVLFGLLIALLVPVFGVSVIALARLVGNGLAGVVYSTLVLILAMAAGLVVARQVAADHMVLTLGVVAGVVGLVVVLHRWASGFLVLAGLALPITVVFFVAVSPASALIWAEPEEPPATGLVGRPAPIVMIQLDEMPLASIMEMDGTVNEKLFSNFARLAEEGTWYRNALSNSIATTQSVPAILTGRLGARGLSPTALDHPDNLFTLLGSDYEMHVIEWVADMCPDDICPDYAGRAPARFSSLLADVGVVYMHLSLPAPAREGLPSIDNSWKGFLGQGDDGAGTRVPIDGLPVPAPPTRVQWIDWIQRLANGIAPDTGRPVLSYAHVQAPHVPWVTNPSGTHYVRPEDYSEVEGVSGDGRWTSDPRSAQLGFQRHLYQVGMLDTMLGRLFEQLDESGTWDETMVVVIADHGASFVPGQHRRWPYEDNRDDLYRVPMFVKYPGQTAGVTVDEPVFGIDLLPTMAEVLDIRTKLVFDGMSLFDVAGTDRPHQPIWWCCSRDSASTDIEVLFAQVERNHGWIPDQESWLGVAGIGLNATLIGEETSQLAVVSDESFSWYLELGGDIVTGAGPRGVTQTYLQGRVVMPAGEIPPELLVSVNGRIAGMGQLVPDAADGATFRALIAEELVVPGPNQLDLLILDAGGVWHAGVNTDLSVDLVTNDGRLLEIHPEGSRRLQVDNAGLVDDTWVILGWAADVNRKQTPDVVYVFAGSELLAWGPPNVDNANVVRWFGSEQLLRSGFEFEVPAASMPPGVAQVTVVAEFGDYAIGDEARLDLSEG